MHVKPIPTDFQLARRLLLPALGLALGACISDGPNKTGGEYLERHGVVLETPLLRVVLADLPVDTFWASEAGRGLGARRDSLLLLGSRDGFNAQLRLGFRLTDTTFLDSLEDEGTLRLSLAFPLLGRGRQALEASVAGVDSMRFLVESWAVPAKGLSDDDLNERLAAYTLPFFRRYDTSLVLDSATRVADTVVLAVSSVYTRDSLQARPLPRLRERLLTATDSRWYIYTQVTGLSDTGAGATAMLRPAGRLAFSGNAFSAAAPSLILGDARQTALTAAAKDRVGPVLGFDSRTWYSGGDGTLLTGINRGLHLSLDRATLLSAVDSALAAQGVDFRSKPAGEYDLGYFVPYARIGVPIDTPSRIEGGHPLEFGLSSDLDSLLPGIGSFALARDTLPVGEWKVISLTTERNNPSKVRDTVKARYEDFPGDPGLRRLVLANSSLDSTRNDTLYLAPGQRRETTRSGLALTVIAGADSAIVETHVNTRSTLGENFVFRDPVTGNALDDLSQRIPRFLTPRTDTLSMRATRAVQQLFNRTQVGSRLRSDILIVPANLAAADTASKTTVSFPVLGEVRPRLTGGALRVSLTLYLYPLKER